jgi:hypothetical protein
MKRLLVGLSVVIGAWVLSPTPEADARGWHRSRTGQRHHVRRHHPRSRVAVPELDPGAAGSAMVLLLGGVAYIASRRREESLG